jgi:hypothetical protein
MVTAKLAGIGPLRLDPDPLGFTPTLRTFEALPKANFEKVIEAGFIVRKEMEELGCRKGLLARRPSYRIGFLAIYIRNGWILKRCGVQSFSVIYFIQRLLFA